MRIIRNKIIGFCLSLSFGCSAALGIAGYHSEPSISDFLKYLGSHLPIKREDKNLKFDMKAFDTYFAQAQEKLGSHSIPDSFKQKIKKEIEKAQLAEMPQKNATISLNQQSVTLMIDPHENTIAVTEELAKRVSARKSWELIKDAIQVSGEQVVTIEGVNHDGGMRELFTRDRFIIVEGKAFIPDIKKLSEIAKKFSKPKKLDDYKGEISQIKKFLTDYNVATNEVTGSWFEGGNIIVYPSKKIIFMGLEPFADPKSAELLEKSIRRITNQQYAVIPLNMAGYEAGKFYHLDTFMSPPLKNGEIFLYKDILDNDSFVKLKDAVGENNIHLITRDEAIAMGTNLNNTRDDTVVVTKDIPRLSKVMKEWGYKIISPNDFGLESFQISNAGVRCMTSFTIPVPGQ